MKSDTLSSTFVLALLAEVCSARSLDTTIEALSIAGAATSNSYPHASSKSILEILSGIRKTKRTDCIQNKVLIALSH